MSSDSGGMRFELVKRVSKEWRLDKARLRLTTCDILVPLTHPLRRPTKLMRACSHQEYWARLLGSEPWTAALGIRTHHLKLISYRKAFIPQGCESTTDPVPALTFGSRAQFSNVLEFANENNLTMPGGSDTTVGVGGGYLQGGGPRIFGLAVDRVLDYEIVVPTGDLLIANECQNPDLFFALRGGRGGTFGVVMQVTTRALPRAELITYATLPFPFLSLTTRANSVSATFKSTTPIERFLEFVIPYSVRWASDGWSGYIYTPGLFHLSKLETTEEDALAYLAPLKTFLEKELDIELQVSTSHSYGELHEKYLHLSSVGLPKCIPRVPSIATHSRRDLLRLTQGAAEHLNAAHKHPPGVIHLRKRAVCAPPAMARRASQMHGGASGTSVTFGQVWNYSASPVPLRVITPGDGTYGNEADVYEPDWERAFWGENHEELVRVKRKYDPEYQRGAVRLARKLVRRCTFVYVRVNAVGSSGPFE
ncbi:uncharacterized protein ARMOST_20108 [Armillaria ostoyae]|uniref:FAD-binding PCMH-type domain-containing protein n=1 Tax=Armillaria ostoyae TaxID=47428 RepID=A0A284S6E3_ARMOS|nr:uncharacterized protein ARMOST_20108 [Armillaria ostoyae]